MTAPVVRTPEPEQLLDALTPIFHFFGVAVDQGRRERFAPVLPADRAHVAYDDGKPIGAASTFPFELTVPGGRTRAGGVTLVGVLPTHRRRGVLRQLMRAQLDGLRERGEPIAYLWASEATIYGRFGYGIASLAGEIDLERRHATFAAPLEPIGRTRLVSVEEALELFPPVYERVAAQTPGMFGRTDEWWRARVLADPQWRRDGGGEMARVVLDVDGRAEAYALYRLSISFEHGSSTGSTTVTEAMGATPAAARAIWRYLLDVDWMDRVRAWLLPVDHPLFLLLAEPRRMRFTVGDGLWLRLVDVEAALGARSYAAETAVAFELADPFCPWNEGRWRVGGGGARRTDDMPELRLDVTALASVYLGGFTFRQLARAGRVTELAAGAIERADALFRTDVAPWCPEIF